ncbi:hypothetical protein GGS20DRAFT_32590 [Poronia punctata]|nr:hypothetical protein GGS20DRAFT_32590 [Poronia punctata]
MAMHRTAGIQQLPYELMAKVVEDLEPEDVFHLSLCSKQFQYIIREDRFCKLVVMAKAAHTLEALEAHTTGCYSRAFRRIVKRRQAISQASPYAVGVMARAHSYGFFNGILCYIVYKQYPRELRILDVAKSASWELVVDIPKLITSAVPEAANKRKYKFNVLYQAAGLVSCLLTLGRKHWLLIIKPQEQLILDALYLDAAHRIFVRNNSRYLYFGTHTGIDAYDNTIWVLKGFDIQKRSWLDHPRLFLENITGNDIRESVCFEIFGEYFYGLGNQSIDDAHHASWQSKYVCFRFPLNDPTRKGMELMEGADSWRRSHSEGPLDERGGFISLDEDEATGKLKISECRIQMSAAPGGPRRQRTHYMTEVIFRPRDRDSPLTVIRPDPGSEPDTASLLTRFRGPHNVHVGDHKSIDMGISAFSPKRMYFSTYFPSCQTFLDLMNGADPDTSSERLVRLRSIHKMMKPSGFWCIGKDLPASTAQPPTNTVFTWPPKEISTRSSPSSDKVQKLLEVEGHVDRATAYRDDRCIVYSLTNDSDSGAQSLVLISFDPAVRFKGMESITSVSGQQTLDAHDGEILPDAETEESSSGMLQFGSNAYVEAQNKEKGRDVYGPESLWSAAHTSTSPADRPCLSLSIHDSAAGAAPWARYEEAMHLGLRKKLYLGR